MCAGNTKEEALVQEISELIERHVNRIVFEYQEPIPVIEPSVYNSNKLIRDVIDEIEKNGYRILIKDCSFNKFPVVALILLDKGNNYFVKFGSHPNFNEAITRCLTELYQGRATNTFQLCSSFAEGNNDENLLNIFTNGKGKYPKIFFDESLISENPKKNFSNMSSNTEFLAFLIDILTREQCTILTRDVSFLGFPAYQVVIPCFSEIININEAGTKLLGKKKKSYSYFNLNRLLSEDYDFFIEYVKKNNIRFSALIKKSVFNVSSVNKLLSYICLNNHDFDNSLLFFGRYLSKIANYSEFD